MRIPRSTIVMAALTCIPFGFALRDYFTGKDTIADLDDDYESDDDHDEDYAKYEAERRAEEAREAERAEERKKELSTALDSLIGTSTASLGTAFGPIKLGMTDSELTNAEETTSALLKLARRHDLEISFEDSEGVLANIAISMNDNADDSELMCNVLSDKLAANWSAAGDAQDTNIWLDPATGIRAEMTSEDDCSFVFRRFVPVEKWVAKKDGLIPTWAIGQSHAKLVKSLEPMRLDLSDAEHEISWSAPGLGEGTTATQITASIAKGKVVGIAAYVSVSSKTKAELVARLGALYGESTDDDDGVLHWAKKPPVAFVDDYAVESGAAPNSVLVTIGTVPEE